MLGVMAVGLCKLCLREHTLIKAHIIPEAFFRDMTVDEIPVALFSGTKGVMPKRMPTGPWDAAILCEECEKRFDTWDSYGVEFLRRPLTELRLITTGDRCKVFAPVEFDYGRFKLFVLSVLWRAHATSLHFFSDVALGPFEPKLRAMLMAADAGPQEEFGVWVLRYEGAPGPVVEPPTRARPDGVNVYMFHFALHDLSIHVDGRQPTASWFPACAIAPGRTPVILVCPWIGGPKTGRIQRMAARLRNVEASWPRTPGILRKYREGRDAK